jgi:hypothetical protein
VATASIGIRPVWLLAALLVGLLAAEAVAFVEIIDRGSELYLGMDYLFYRDLGVRWLADGQWYLPFQFAPHEFTNMVSNVYPPSALPLFVGAAVMPWIVWWAVPIAVLGFTLYRWRPSPWAWVAILVLMMWPRSIGGYLYGNTTMWTSAGLAAGLAWGWPVVLLAIKPSVAPFALLALRHRSAWVAGLVVAVLSLPMLPLWLDYLTVMRNQTSTHLVVILGDVPLMLVPLVAWWGRRAA